MHLVWIDTDYINDWDEAQSLTYALVLHLAGVIRIVGISAGYPRGKVSEIKKVFNIFKRAGYPLTDIPIYEGALNKDKPKLKKKTVKALDQARIDGALFCAWGSLTTFRAYVEQSIFVLIPLHAICSWNREQDQKSYDVINDKYVHYRTQWIDNEKDFRNGYLGWDLDKNREWVKKIAAMLPPLIRKLWLKAASKIKPTGTWKGGDTASIHWAATWDVKYPLRYKTNRKKMLNLFEECINLVFNESV